MSSAAQSANRRASEPALEAARGESEAWSASGELPRTRVLQTLIHAVLFISATGLFTVATMVLCEDSPWTLDIESTRKMLGVPALLAQHSQDGSDLDSWIQGACSGGSDGGAAGARVALLVRILYQTVAGCSAALALLVLAVSFLAPRIRPLVFAVQITLCGAFGVLSAHLLAFHPESRHLKSSGLALLLNFAACLLQALDFSLSYRRRMLASKAKAE
ncbi:hypothetical protein T484DRAFT_2941706 [Baffinella frigidus]|nr:hypothetical protein T484DRAFT_2941706 [Cryptophyta sp. CCMP2293]